ncbi:hypothetical protein [Crateriforma conspicua]|uniref:Uncharacterized protein n=1 Tax=Crateriforma conspicua TaxID=2527996 RepID=A0A5C5Y0V7_9PLAN|nr:hypothetical protein [Crateriforma conspicua]QDV63874.1 hypothetical protein Mal65_30210 [Crateriforma conspicua]TWT69237.1 hypothetical protein Pan14r_15220 [Crateriforma conspicua]
MAQLTIFLGVLLCIQTVFALFINSAKYPAEFIPMIVGIPVLFVGVVSLNPHRRRRMGWFLLCLATVGLLFSSGLSLRWFGHAADHPGGVIAVRLAGAMGASCLALVFISLMMLRRRAGGNGGGVSRLADVSLSNAIQPHGDDQASSECQSEKADVRPLSSHVALPADRAEVGVTESV